MMPRKMDKTISEHVKNIKSATFRNLDESFRASSIAAELGVSTDVISAHKFPTAAGSWAWKYLYQNNEYTNLTDVVTAMLRSANTADNNLHVLAQASSSANIFVAFRDFMVECDYDFPVIEEELLDLLREFARDVWVETGDISDIRKHYATFKMFYLKKDFEEFVRT